MLSSRQIHASPSSNMRASGSAPVLSIIALSYLALVQCAAISPPTTPDNAWLPNGFLGCSCVFPGGKDISYCGLHCKTLITRLRIVVQFWCLH
ncbi:hypothetical protein SISSUDRAFT_1132076 [Sistotremastrum suecicum HHB10207 ss-3]|uniref:Uncharacterized protein n=1 Tax=Sistotremastrum suecicum HHB10207 ss-3 TaxID=1314776 RepID=A0A165ZB68_9AGAM|nr:hypothetical protein SISSUDRAFT_1132076 [Sistotremastrum suecicum HHB10207 ss-3]